MRVLNCEQAIAEAAKAQYLVFASGYPGSPGGGVLSYLIESDPENSNYHWSGNEKIALEKGIGVAINGDNALVCVKSVGLNAMLDPLTVVNLTPLTGGLVIVVGDDPGAYGSQNDQDSRPLAQFLNLPWFEPTSVQMSYDLISISYRLSKAFGLPIFIRITRYMAQQTGELTINKVPLKVTPNLENFVMPRFVPGPKNAVAKNEELRHRMSLFASAINDLKVNPTTNNDQNTGIIACGATAVKLKKFLEQSSTAPDFDLLQLSSIFPLPEKLITKFISNKEKVIVIEENSSFIINQCKVIATNNKINTNWISLANPGELDASKLLKLANNLNLNSAVDSINLTARPAEDKPCSKSRYDEVLNLFKTASENLGLSLKYYADPGCMVSVMDQLEGKFALGGSVATVFGANLSGNTHLNIAFVGDSGLFHSAYLAICDAVYHKASIPIVFLNNNVALTTGGQRHLGSAEGGSRFNYRQFFNAAGLNQYLCFNLNEVSQNKNDLVKEFLQMEGLRLLQIDID